MSSEKGWWESDAFLGVLSPALRADQEDFESGRVGKIGSVNGYFVGF